jgi:hypothetical protein
MFRRYFQTGDEEDQEGSSGDEEAEQVEQVPPPEEVWAQVGRGSQGVVAKESASSWALLGDV